MDCPAPLSMGFSRQEHWRGLPLPPPGDVPNPGIELVSPALQSDSLPLSHMESIDYINVLKASSQVPGRCRCSVNLSCHPVLPPRPPDGRRKALNYPKWPTQVKV